MNLDHPKQVTTLKYNNFNIFPNKIWKRVVYVDRNIDIWFYTLWYVQFVLLAFDRQILRMTGRINDLIIISLVVSLLDKC